MPFFRIFGKGFKIAVRQKKKNFAMIFIFVILSATMIISLTNLQKYETDQLVNFRGIVIDFNRPFIRANDSYDFLLGLLGLVKEKIRGFYVVYEFKVETISVITIYKFEGKGLDSEVPWVLDPFKKSKIIAGRYIISDNEAVAHTGFNIKSNVSGVIVTDYFGVGSEISFERDGDVLKLKIVGLVNSSTEEFKSFASENESILLVSPKAFDDLVRRVFRESTTIDRSPNVKLRRVIITIGGEPLSGGLFATRNEIFTKIQDYMNNNNITADVRVGAIAQESYFRDLAFFIIVLAFILVLTVIYAYIIIKAMHFDIATLRAIGWSGRDVITLVFGQLVFIFFVGWLIGLFSSLAYYAVLVIPILSAEPFFGSILVILVAMLVSYGIIKRRVLRIPPMEAFRRG